MIIAFLGGILSFIMQKSGVAEQMIKNGAELIGDNPLVVAIASMTLVGLLFTTIGGLGAVIMVSIVLIPMMATVGIPPIVAGGILVIGISLGGSMNAGNWVRFVDGMDIPYAEVRNFAIVVFVHVYAAGLCFISVEMWRKGVLKSTSTMLGIVFGSIGLALLIVLGVGFLSGGGAQGDSSETPPWLLTIQIFVGIALVVLLGKMLVDLYLKIERWRQQIVTIKWYAYLIPIIPLVFIIVYQIDPYTSFMIGIAYAMLATARPGSISLTIQSMIQGASTVMPAVILFMGIGLLIMVFKGPGGWEEEVGREWPTLYALKPYFSWIVPNKTYFLIFFGIFAPMALYRGPLNTWGLGFGVAAILTGTVGFSAPIIMAMLLMVGQIQGVCDPTNTDNVWISNELRIDVQKLMLQTLPYMWVMAIIGLITSVFFFVPDEDSWQAELRERMAGEVETIDEAIDQTTRGDEVDDVSPEGLNTGLPTADEVLETEAPIVEPSEEEEADQ